MRPLLLALVLLAAAAPAAHARFSTLPPGFSEQAVTSGDFFLPVGAAPAPDGRIFVVEKRGLLRVWTGTERRDVLDLQAEVNSYSDRGMLGVAVDKDFASNGFVYILYTREKPGALTGDQDVPTASRLERLTINSSNVVTSRRTILGTYADAPCPPPSNTVDCIPSDHGWHSIGTVRVDPADGTLWVGSGDGHGHSIDGDSYRPYDEASYAGKILHIDRDGKGLPGHPFCPAEADLTKVCTKLYAKGFRNPFRFTVRPSGKGVVAGDVGFSQREEVDLVKAGKNYGWPCYEGTERTDLYKTNEVCTALYAKEGTADGATPPVWDYAHGDGASITGGPEIVSGGNLPAVWAGDVIVGDYVNGWLRRLDLDGGDQLLGVTEIASGGSGLVDLQVLPSGHLGYVDLGYVSGTPELTRLVYTPTNEAPTARITASTTRGAAPLTVTFSATTSSDPDGDALTYAWDLDGDGATDDSTSATPSRTYTTDGEYVVRLVVDDGRGQTSSAQTTIRVGSDAPPVPQITSPADEAQFRNGVAVTLQGTATDPEEGAVPSGRLEWTVTLVHAGHFHPAAVTPATGPTVQFTPETDHDADSYYRVVLKATDSGGRSATTEIQLRPKTRSLTLDSTPKGAPLRWDGADVVAPSTKAATAVGYRPTVEAAPSFTKDGRTYAFVGWSDGGARSHTATVPDADSSLVARYERTGVRTLRLAPTADTYVDATAPTLAFGDGLALLVDKVPEQRSLVRFAPAGIGADTVVGARLRVFARDGSSFGGDVRVLGDDAAWNERTTWANRPSIAGTPVAGSFGAITYDRWHDLALSPAALGGDGTLELAIASEKDDGTAFGSRESPQPPELVLEVATAPSTSITGGPDGPGNDATPTFTLGGAASYECRIDGGTWASCASPWTTPALADGPHAVEVRGTSAEGGIDASPATRSFSVDTDPPDTSIVAGPVGETTEPSPVFSLAGSSGTVSFECRLDGAAWAACTTPWAPGKLAGGEHVAQARALDAVGNADPEPAERRFTVVAPTSSTPPPAARPAAEPPAAPPAADTRPPGVTVPASARRPVRAWRLTATRWTASFRLLFDEAVTGTLELRTAAGRLLGRSALRAGARRTVVAAVLLNRTARRRLRRDRRVRVTLRVRDAAGNARTVRWSVTVRRPRAADTKRPRITVPASARRPVRPRRLTATRWTASFRLLFDEAVTGTLEMRTAAGTLLGRSALRAGARRTVVAAVLLNRIARRQLRRDLRVRVTLRVRDAAGNARAVRWSVTVRRRAIR